MTSQSIAAESTVAVPVEPLAAISIKEPPNFPQEIIDLFIDGLSQYLERKDAQDALQACALVSHSFSALSRKHLFSTIIIFPRVPSLEYKQSTKAQLQSRLRSTLYTRLLSLTVLLESKSDFKSLIRAIRIQVDMDGIILGKYSSLHSVLDALRSHAKHLETFWITGDAIKHMSWPKNGTPIRRSFANLLSSMKLRSLRFANVRNLPTDVLAICPSIQSLALTSVTFEMGNNTRPQQLSHTSFKPIQLNELSLHRCKRAFQSAQLNIDLSKLRRFKASLLSREEAYGVPQLIGEAKNSLTCLELTLRTDRRVDALQGVPIDFGKLPNLSNLRLCIKTWTERLQPWAERSFLPMKDAFSLLKPPTHPTSLKSIDILLNFTTTAQEALHLIPTDDTPWRSLDPGALREKHPHLQTVYIKLDITLVSIQPEDSEKQNIAKSLRSQIISIVSPSPSASLLSSTAFEVDVVLSPRLCLGSRISTS